MSTRIRFNARMPPDMSATTSIKVVIGRFMAKTVGFMAHPDWEQSSLHRVLVR